MLITARQRNPYYHANSFLNDFMVNDRKKGLLEHYFCTSRDSWSNYLLFLIFVEWLDKFKILFDYETFIVHAVTWYLNFCFNSPEVFIVRYGPNVMEWCREVYDMVVSLKECKKPIKLFRNFLLSFPVCLHRRTKRSVNHTISNTHLLKNVSLLNIMCKVLNHS